MTAGNGVLANVYRGESDFRKIGENEAKVYKTSVYKGGMQFFYIKNERKV